MFLLHFPAIDANNSGEEEEVESDEDFIYIVGIILMELKKSRDKQANRGKPSFDL